MKEITLKARELVALVLVVLALLVLAFFGGITIGERHERAKLARVEVSSKVASPPAPTSSVVRKKAPEASGKAAESRARTEKAEKTAPAKEVLKKGYYIQVGAFKSKERAVKWRNDIKSKGFHRVRVIYSSARSIYRVVIGPYSSKELAVRVARKVDRVFKVRSSVVPDIRLR